MAINWTDDWKEAKKFFEKQTGKSKPDAGSFLKVFTKHSTGVNKSIKSLKGTYDAAQTAKPITAELIKSYVKAIKSYTKVKNEYLSVLEKAIVAEIKDKGAKTVYSKGCQYLKKSLIAIESAAESQVDWLNAKLKDSSVIDGMASALISTIHSCIDKCLAAGAKVKTSPTVEDFSKILYTPARDLSQYIGNIGVLRKKGKVFPDHLDDKTAKQFYDRIRPFGDERIKKMLKDDATDKEVVAKNKEFINHVKDVKKWMQ